jgi:hypothetical protein
MRGLALLLSLCLLAAPAAAQTLVVRAEACAALTRHVPDPGVAYAPTPGVAPADLAGAAPPLGEIALRITLDLRRRFGLPRLLDEGELGTVTLQDGKALLDGRPLAADAEAALALLCREKGPWRDPPR